MLFYKIMLLTIIIAMPDLFEKEKEKKKKGKEQKKKAKEEKENNK